ncbi:MAG: DNA repair protein RadA [Oscillospiraceae bacterium]|jgi:DNA repair protein RadA/Sms|nr:DNA repair protein RadA [Oscillospiraceae bacterium]
MPPKAKSKTVFVCSACGREHLRWSGQCAQCGEWNTINEEVRTAPSAAQSAVARTAFRAQPLSDITADNSHRYRTGLGELDRVLGGGLVKGSVVLLGGDPGIGKSTILLQICEEICKQIAVLYISGEESPHQLKLRADRLCVQSPNLRVLCETDVLAICEHIRAEKPGMVIVDSIQTMQAEDIPSSPGSVTQVRESTHALQRVAKQLDIPIFLVGHVNKDGNIAGPKVLEHIVDAVLYFEGERHLSYRILRAVKNRFGSTNEIGVFEMSGHGLQEVENPSMMLIGGRPKGVSGSCVACVMEGSRPILAEVQGLVAPTGFGNPRRMTNGVDGNRLAMLIAVLEKRAGYFFGNMDTYINVIGGLKLDEPSTDLSVALALVSGLKDLPVPSEALVFGEIGLGGELRAVAQCEQRVREAARLGFAKCVLPKQNLRGLPKSLKSDIAIIGAQNVRDAVGALIGDII